MLEKSVENFCTVFLIFLTKSVIFGTLDVLDEKKEGKIPFIFLWNWVKVVSQGVSLGGYLGRDLLSKPCYPRGPLGRCFPA